MTKEEFEDELYDILSTSIDEPAGSGCGYGVTEEGQAEIMKLFERINVEEAKVVQEKLYEVTVVKKTQVLHDNGVVKKNACESLVHRKPVVAVSAAAARSKVERSLTKKLEDVAAEALIDQLEVKVENVNF